MLLLNKPNNRVRTRNYIENAIHNILFIKNTSIFRLERRSEYERIEKLEMCWPSLSIDSNAVISTLRTIYHCRKMYSIAFLVLKPMFDNKKEIIKQSLPYQ